MFVNNQNKCQCLDGYVLKPDGINCRFNCLLGFAYNVQADSCLPIIPTCQLGETYNAVSKKC